MEVGLGVIEVGPGLLEEGVRLPAGSEAQHLLDFHMGQLAAAITLSRKRLQSYAREIVWLTQTASYLFRKFNSNARY